MAPQYKGFKSKYRGGWADPMATSQGGPLAPPTKTYDGPHRYNKSSDVPYKKTITMTRDPGPGRSYSYNPTHSASQEMQAYAQKSGYMRNQMMLRRMGKGLSAAAKMAAKFNPYGRAISLGLDIMDALGLDPWMYIQAPQPAIPFSVSYGPEWSQISTCNRDKPIMASSNIDTCIAGGYPAANFFPGQARVYFQTPGSPLPWRALVTELWSDFEGVPGGTYGEKLRTMRRTIPRNSPLDQRWAPEQVAPQPAVQGVPYPIPNVYRPPLSVQMDGGFAPRPRPRPYMPPYQSPARNIPVGPGGMAPPHYRDPHSHLPHPGEKKLKFDAGAAGKLYGGLTEIGDWADAVGKAIPGNPCRGLPLHRKLMCIYRNAGKIDPAKAALNIVMNDIQDRAIGSVGKFGKKAVASAARQGYYKRPVGLSTGFWSHRSTY